MIGRGLILFAVTCGVCQAECLPRAPLSKLEATVVEDARDGRFDDGSMLRAALIAGEPHQDPAPYLARFKQLCRDLEKQIAATTEPTEPEQAAFDFLHARVLVGQFKANSYQVQQSLDFGDYNCLTASILYQAFCEHLQVPVQVVARPGHVACRAVSSTMALIETTCPQWFSRASRRQNSKAPAGDANCRVLSQSELLARVLYNRGIALAQHEQFPHAVASLQISTELDLKFKAARHNRLAAINNWCLWLGDQGDFDQAQRILRQAQSEQPEHAAFWHNDLYLQRTRIQQLAESGKANEARRIRNELVDYWKQHQSRFPKNLTTPDS